MCWPWTNYEAHIGLNLIFPLIHPSKQKYGSSCINLRDISARNLKYCNSCHQFLHDKVFPIIKLKLLLYKCCQSENYWILANSNTLQKEMTRHCHSSCHKVMDLGWSKPAIIEIYYLPCEWTTMSILCCILENFPRLILIAFHK